MEDLGLVPAANSLSWIEPVSRTYLLLDGPAEKQGDLLQAVRLQVIHGQKVIAVKK